MREEGFITAGAGAGGAHARGCGSGRIPARRKRAAGYAKEFLRQQFRDRFGGDHPPDWQVRTTFVPGAAGRGGARGRATACAGSAIRICRRRSSRSIPATGDILAMVGGRDFRESQFNRAWRSAASAGFGVQADSVCRGAGDAATRPSACSTGLSTIAPQGPDEWAPRNASGEDAESLTLRAALIESNNRAGDAAAAAHRIASGAASRLGRRAARSARRAVAVARHRPRHAAAI